jgi:hypothetical protein
MATASLFDQDGCLRQLSGTELRLPAEVRQPVALASAGSEGGDDGCRLLAHDGPRPESGGQGEAAAGDDRGERDRHLGHGEGVADALSVAEAERAEGSPRS